MAKLIVMLISIGGQPALIPGWTSMQTCDAAKPQVETFYRNHQPLYERIDIECQQLAN